MQETQEMQVQPLGGEDPLEEEMATHSRILAWKNATTVHGDEELDRDEHTRREKCREGETEIHIHFSTCIRFIFQNSCLAYLQNSGNFH